MKRCLPLLLVILALSPEREWTYAPQPAGIPVSDSTGREMRAPFLGGFDVPRPQLVDINGDGKQDLFIQERSNELMFFEQVNGEWEYRSDRFQDLPIGEWYRFADIDRDGDMDLFSETVAGYIRVWQNVGTRTAPRFVALGDSLRDVDGKAIVADRQNILNAVDIDCNNKLDLFIGRVQGVVDRYEEEGKSRDGSPRFRLLEESWQGIEVLGPEVTGDVMKRTDTNTVGGPSATERETARLHGANTLTFADIGGHGVYDLFWGDFFEEGLLRFENIGSCQQPNLNSKPPVRFPQNKPVLTSGYNASAFGDADGDNNIDLVMGVIGGAYGPARTSIDNLYYVEQSPRDTWTLKTRRLIPTIDVGAESAPAFGDVNGDGLIDLVIGSKVSPNDATKGTMTWYANVGTATQPALRERGQITLKADFNYAPAIADLDGDGLPDLIVGAWKDRVNWYRNAGTKTDPKWTLADSALVTITRGTNTTPSLGDLNGDGLLDMVIGEASGTINLYKNVGTKTMPKFELVSDNFQSIKVIGRSAPALIDLDGDGSLDMLIGSRDGAVELWRGAGKGGEIRFERDASFVMKSHQNAMPAAGALHGAASPIDIFTGTASGGIKWWKR